MRGMLSFLILFILSRRSMNGQSIARELEKRRGDKPSPGTIYPALKYLREEKLIAEKKSANEAIYSITPKGKKDLAAAKRIFSSTFRGLI
jgi:DNA-binding PadR family transcriptional regulator